MKINKKKIVVPLLVFALVVTTIGGTLAWLMDKTDEVKNTFTVGNVGVTLQEKDKDGNWQETGRNDYQLIPGRDLSKEAKVTLDEGSQDAYVFIKVAKENNFDTYLTSAIDPAWTPLPGVDGVYYKENVKAGDAQTILAGNHVVVKDTLTNTDMMNAKELVPSISFTAYAIQKENIDTVADAWNQVKEAK